MFINLMTENAVKYIYLKIDYFNTSLLFTVKLAWDAFPH